MKALVQASPSGRVPAPPEKRFLISRPCTIPATYGSVVTYRAGSTLAWSLEA